MTKKFNYDERAKILTNTMEASSPLFEKEEYGQVNTKTTVTSNQLGATRILMFLEDQEKGTKDKIASIENMIEGKKKELEEEKKKIATITEQIKDLKDAVGTRINFNKIKKQIVEEKKAKK